VGREDKLHLKLWANVLEKALEDLYYEPPEARENFTTCQNSQVDRELYWKRQAQAWFKGKIKGSNSLEGVCLFLGLEAPWIKKKPYEKGLL
jgi:hypothetical protein